MIFKDLIDRITINFADDLRKREFCIFAVIQFFKIMQILEQNLIRINESNLSVLLEKEQFENQIEKLIQVNQNGSIPLIDLENISVIISKRL